MNRVRQRNRIERALTLAPSADVVNPHPFTSVLSIDVREEASCDPSRIIQLYGQLLSPSSLARLQLITLPSRRLEGFRLERFADRSSSMSA